MVNDNRLVNYCASRRRNTSDVLLLMKKIHSKKSNEVKVRDYKPKNVLPLEYILLF